MQLSATDRAMLGRIGDTFNVFRSLYVDITAAQAVVLLMIASRPGISQSDIAIATGLTEASVSRVVSIFGDKGDRGNGPYDIIDARRSPRDPRAKELFLTSNGSLLMANILREFAGVRYERPPKD